MPDVKSVWNAGLCSGIQVFAGWQRCEAVIKFFTKTNNKTKKIKKRCFFASHDGRRLSRFFAKKYYLKGGDFFPKTQRA